jgi:hypothetical protein
VYISLQCVLSRVPSRSLNPKAADSGKSGHTQYVFVYANNAGCPEEHFESGTLSHGRDDDEGIHMCIFTFVYETISGGLAGANIKSPQLTRKCVNCITACEISLSFSFSFSFAGEDTDCFKGLCDHPRARNWVQCERCGRWFFTVSAKM